MKGSQLIKNDENNYTVIQSKDNTSYVTGIYKRPIVITSEIPYQELCINFNPMGLECLFTHNISAFEFKKNVLDYINPIIRNNLYEIFVSNNNTKTIQDEIEAYFLELINDELNFKIVDKINSIQHSTSIEEIENLLCKSYRTTNRFFNNSFALNPKEFVDIKKIRTAMSLLLENKSVSEVAYELDFTDTPHFIKTFKRYTQQTPTNFKNKASILNNTLVWNLE